MFNGNIGAGAFSLFRFRFVEGTGRDITSIFLSMAIGLANGMGYVGIAVIFTIVICAITYILNVLHFGCKSSIMSTKIKENTELSELS